MPPPTPSTRPEQDRPSQRPSRPDLSVVVPVRNEGPNIVPLVAELRDALRGLDAELIFVDDGSTDDTGARLDEAAGADLRWLRHGVSAGQSAAILAGVLAAHATWIATLDGDGQNDPADIRSLLARAQAETGGSVLVTGHRTARRDSRIKRLSSRIANGVRGTLLGDRTPDTGCGLKVFRRETFLELPRFDHMHRFLPALVVRAGGTVLSVPVGHRPRLRGKSNYGTLDRLAVGITDLLGVMWLMRRWRRPVVIAQGGGQGSSVPASTTAEAR